MVARVENGSEAVESTLRLKSFKEIIFSKYGIWNIIKKSGKGRNETEIIIERNT